MKASRLPQVLETPGYRLRFLTAYPADKSILGSPQGFAFRPRVLSMLVKFSFAKSSTHWGGCQANDPALQILREVQRMESPTQMLIPYPLHECNQTLSSWEPSICIP
jgi:hypothetical protein